MIKIKSIRELEDNLQSIETALRILKRVKDEQVDVQSLYTIASQLNQANNYVNQLIGASISYRLVKVVVS